MKPLRIYPISEQALTIAFSEQISEAANRQVLQLHHRLQLVVTELRARLAPQSAITQFVNAIADTPHPLLVLRQLILHVMSLA